jgi:hypothetical protein
MTITRKRFLQSMSGGTVVLLFQACGGGGYSGSSTGGGYGNPMPQGGCGASGTQIADNHSHQLVIPSADLTSTTSKSYSIMGGAMHDHTVNFTAAQLAQLMAGQAVGVTSTTTDVSPFGPHSHVVTASCP